MKQLLIVLVLVGLLAGGYYLMNKTNSSETVGSAMPVQGASGVDTTLVSEVKEFTLDSFEFGFNQKTLTVQKGDTVTITLTNSGNMMHDWVVDEYSVRTKQITNGQTDSVTFVADKTGTFEFYCSVGKHRANGMVGKLVVE